MSKNIIDSFDDKKVGKPSIGTIVPNGILPKEPENETPAGNKWPVETVGGANQTYSPGDTSFIKKEENAGTNAGNSSGSVQQEKESIETSIDELRSRYMNELMDEYERSIGILRDERDEALRENWILQQQAMAALPEQMAAAGINGGATETSLANLMAEYQGNRNDIQSGYMDNLGKLAKEQSGKKMEAEKDFSQKWIEYLMNLANMEKEHEYDMELARFR